MYVLQIIVCFGVEGSVRNFVANSCLHIYNLSAFHFLTLNCKQGRTLNPKPEFTCLGVLVHTVDTEIETTHPEPPEVPYALGTNSRIVVY